MDITLLHPPHSSIGSRVPGEHLPPYGLLAIGGSLIDAGHQVRLINADIGPMDPRAMLRAVRASGAQAVMVGHSGSTTAHLTVLQIAQALKADNPDLILIYGGVHPTYHWRETLQDCSEIDVIVRGEGEETAPRLMRALDQGLPLAGIPGLAFRDATGAIRSTGPAPMIPDLDAYRIGWELIDFADYSYWGGKRAVILQFSRGCPHLCTYCGQRGFWSKWRHRDPVKFAAEIARLVREHGIELVNLADENPTSSRRVWKRFLEALIAEDVEVRIIGSTRAGDIVRDIDILPLYKRAGVLRFLLGVESTDQAILQTIRKAATTTDDQRAIAALRANGMIGLCTFAVGFGRERDRDYLAMLRQLLVYDPDQIMSVFATPLRWTPFFRDTAQQRVVELDLRKWDYKHQVLAGPVPEWRVLLWVRVIEACLQLRPKALWRTYLHPDPEMRHAMRWYSRMGRRVVLRETWEFLQKPGIRRRPTVAQILGGEAQFAEMAMARKPAIAPVRPDPLGPANLPAPPVLTALEAGAKR